MPLYTLSHSTPASTLRSAPVTTTIPVEPGVIIRVAVQFPRGCAGLAHAQILRGGSVIWPTNIATDLASDGFVIEWEEDYPVPQLELWSLATWNDDDTYPHRITAWINLRAARRPAQNGSSLSLLQRLRALVS